MIAVAGGLGAALCWAFATIATSRSSKLIGASAVIGWVMLVGVAVAVIPAALTPPDKPLELGAVVLAVVAGVTYVTGLYLTYRALKIGPVGIAAPVVSTEGAIAAVIAVFLGEPLGLEAAFMLGLIVLGVVLASIAPSAMDAGATVLRVGSSRTTATLAIAAALVFGVGLVTSARSVGMGMPVAWVALVARLIGVIGFTIPLALSHRLPISRRVAPLVIVAGVGEVLGTAVYTIGAQEGIAIAAIVASQFATIATVLAYFIYGERLGRLQMAGIGLVIVGVTAVSALSA
jgi:drug/metabolite transporter (DMT)-like permease